VPGISFFPVSLITPLAEVCRILLFLLRHIGRAVREAQDTNRAAEGFPTRGDSQVSRLAACHD